jgi:hypothetical protein
LLDTRSGFEDHKVRTDRMAQLIRRMPGTIALAASVTALTCRIFSFQQWQPIARTRLAPRRCSRKWGTCSLASVHELPPSGDFPRQRDDRLRHSTLVKRGAADHGAAALPCRARHQSTNTPTGVPGAQDWHLAPLEMAWEGLTAGEICRLIFDPARCGFTTERLLTHLGSDNLVLWAWSAGVDLNGKSRRPPPMFHDDFMKLVREWIAAGAACPA